MLAEAMPQASYKTKSLKTIQLQKKHGTILCLFFRKGGGGKPFEGKKVYYSGDRKLYYEQSVNVTLSSNV